MKILIVGADLTSNGGIASVVKSYYEAYVSNNYNIELRLLKTTYYKDRNTLHNVLKFLQAVIIFLQSSIECKFDIVHIHTSAGRSFYRKSVFVFLSRIFKSKVILHIHSSDFYNFFLRKSSFKQFVFEKSSSVVVLCRDWDVKMKSLYPSLNITKIENPFSGADFNVSSNITKFSKSNSKFVVLFVGFLIESKGIHDLIELAVKFKESKLDNILIKIAGKGPLENFLINSIESRGLADNLEYIGWVDGDLKRLNYESASLFILPSYKEGMPISILEAMSYGLPIISTSIAGIPDLISNGVNGFLTEPGNIEDYFKFVSNLSSDPILLQNLSINAVERAKHNSKEKIFNEVVNLYSSMISS